MAAVTKTADAELGQAQWKDNENQGVKLKQIGLH